MKKETENYRPYESVQVLEVFHQSQYPIKMHDHEYFEMVYVTEGSTDQIIDGRRMNLKKGDYFIIDYGVSHKYEIEPGKSFRAIMCLFVPQFIDKSIQLHSLQAIFSSHLIKFEANILSGFDRYTIFKDNDGQIYRLMKQMLTEYKEKQVGYIELVRCNLIEIIVRMLRPMVAVDKVALGGTSAYIEDYIEKNFLHEITLSQISRNLNYSVPYLSKKFKEDMGETFSACVQKRRVEEACRLLANTKKSITEVAEMSGYTSMKFFGKVFKKYIGMTPKEYRKKCHSEK